MLIRRKQSGKWSKISALAWSLLGAATPAWASEPATVEDSLGLAIDRALNEEHYDAIWQVGTRLEGVEAAWQAPNRAEDLRTFFLRDGVVVVPRSGGVAEWDLRMGLRSIGRGDALRRVGEAQVSASGQRVELRRTGIVEWYRNDERGLEQGFDISERPAGSGALELVVDIEGELVVDELTGERVEFTDEHGEHTLTMEGLFTVDAGGKELETRFERRGEELAIVVEDAGAVYPITIDPLITNEVAKLTIDGAAPGALLGTSIDQLSTRAVVGAPGSSVAYVFRLQGGAWEIEAKLGHSSVVPGDQFGCDVALRSAPRSDQGTD